MRLDAALPLPLVVLLYLLVALLPLTVFVEHPGLNCVVRFGDMVYGTAPRPYVTRVLLPAVAHAVSVATPPAVRSPLAGWVARTLGRRPRLDFTQEYGYELIVVVLLLYGSLVGFAFCVRSLALRTIDLPRLAGDVVPILALLLLPVTFACASFIYDFPTAYLFALGLTLTARGSISGYLAVFALATLSKETSLLLIPVWLVHNAPVLPRTRLRVLGLLQLAIWLLARGLLAYAFRDNPGTLVQWHLPQNLSLLTSPATYVEFKHILGLPLIPRGLNVVLLATAPLLILGWRLARRLLRAAFLLALPLAVLVLLFGQVNEPRACTEAYPAVLLLLAGGVWSLFSRGPLQPRDTPDPARTRRLIDSPAQSPIIPGSTRLRMQTHKEDPVSGAIPNPAAPPAPETDVDKAKGTAWLSYIGILWLIPLLTLKDNAFARFHVKQGIILDIATCALGIVFGVLLVTIIVPILVGVAWVALLIFRIMGIVNAAGGKHWKVPILGKWAEAWFKF